jgi:hypothetical protein
MQIFNITLYIIPVSDLMQYLSSSHLLYQSVLSLCYFYYRFFSSAICKVYSVDASLRIEPVVGYKHNQSLVRREPVAMEASFHMQIWSAFDFQL